jgi:hypothetical protein
MLIHQYFGYRINYPTPLKNVKALLGKAFNRYAAEREGFEPILFKSLIIRE